MVINPILKLYDKFSSCWLITPFKLNSRNILWTVLRLSSLIHLHGAAVGPVQRSVSSTVCTPWSWSTAACNVIDTITCKCWKQKLHITQLCYYAITQNFHWCSTISHRASFDRMKTTTTEHSQCFGHFDPQCSTFQHRLKMPCPSPTC